MNKVSLALRGWFWLLTSLMLVSYRTLAVPAWGSKPHSCANRQRAPIIIAKGPKSDSSGCLQRRGIAAAAAGKATGAAPSGNHACIAYARPVTIT